MDNIAAWNALTVHRQTVGDLHMRDMFEATPTRFREFSLSCGDILCDFSKNRITSETVRLLCELARERDLAGQRDAMFAGQPVNTTENRAVLHMALRGHAGDAYRTVDGDVSQVVSDVLRHMAGFVTGVHSGKIAGATGRRLTDVVNIGIGGSHLGPEMVVAALAPYHLPDLRLHFVSNIDGHDLASTLDDLDPETTLFLIASKTFTTQETMTNARSARAWVTEALGDGAVSHHFAAISSNRPAVDAFGIHPAHVFEFWDWVGGRLSLWSSVGLSIALAVGMENFRMLLDGARETDIHFRDTPLPQNIPVMLGLIGLWNINFLGYDSLAILPYDHRLARLPAFLQQLDMESNGKSVTRTGECVTTATGPLLFGEPGTNGQHAFYQLLHQGTKIIPADFIIVAQPAHALANHHDRLLANALAQSEALMTGRTLAESDGNPHRRFPGNRPTNTLVMRRLDPHTLGMLIALYEHKVFVQGALWGINSFDQWGVELGKQLATRILAKIEYGKDHSGLDGSTVGLLKQLEAWRN